MNATELRIGNIVNQDSEKFKTGKVLSINSKSILLENQYRTQRALIKKIQPIPLTEECIIKFGFIKDGECFFKTFSVQGEFLLFSNKTPVAIANNIKYPFYFTHRNVIGISYVHQLQNIYFALTCEELILK